MSRIFLVGFMASGKSSVGSALAARLGVPFVDLDREIEATTGMGIPAIFARDGEPGFRELEHQALRRTATGSAAVVATGGGTMIAERNRTVLRELGTTVWLDASFEIILDRLDLAGRRQRPLFENEAQARELYQRRLPHYRLADHRVEIEVADTAQRVAARIDDLLARVNLCGT